MFDSFRDKLRSVVQDGIQLNNAVRQKISQAHHSARPHKPGPSVTEDRVNPCVGSSLLEKYQQEWQEIHETAEKCSRGAEMIDCYMAGVHQTISKQLENISQINGTLSTLPKVIADVDDCVGRLKALSNKYNEVENDLIKLELIIDRCDFEQRKVEHTFQLSMYKEKKFAALENSRISLVTRQTEALREADKRQRDMLKEKQLAASQAFHEDLVLYKTQGELPRKLSFTKDKTSEVTLEEIQLNADDSTALDEFLNEGT